jgi:outer membrane protein OmpA-like peptidoglycan-associated protein
MINLKHLSGTVLALAATTVFSVCGAAPRSHVVDGHTDQPVWPAIEDARPLVASTVYADVAAFGKIVVGSPKLEIYRLLGHPMYSEGLGGVHEWNYVFKFPAQTAGQFVTCQYKVLFDNDMLARETYWNPVQCADVVAPKAAVAEQAPVQAPAASHVAATVDASADFLFDFESATLSADAPAAIDAKLTQMFQTVQNVEGLRVVGYTDRFGSPAHNLDLSQRRAESVKRYLVSQGIPDRSIFTQGRGASEPVVTCPGEKSPSVVECLKPNRRVRIEVVVR